MTKGGSKMGEILIVILLWVGIFWSTGLFIHRVWKHVNEPQVNVNEPQVNVNDLQIKMNEFSPYTKDEVGIYIPEEERGIKKESVSVAFFRISGEKEALGAGIGIFCKKYSQYLAEQTCDKCPDYEEVIHGD